MLIAEMAPKGNGSDAGAGSCGLTTWGTNSQITHVSAARPEGPYARANIAVPMWSHNPLVRLMPDGTLVLYHIGSGSAGGLPPLAGYCGQNATSPWFALYCVYCGFLVLVAPHPPRTQI